MQALILGDPKEALERRMEEPKEARRPSYLVLLRTHRARTFLCLCCHHSELRPDERQLLRMSLSCPTARANQKNTGRVPGPDAAPRGPLFIALGFHRLTRKCGGRQACICCCRGSFRGSNNGYSISNSCCSPAATRRPLDLSRRCCVHSAISS